MRRAIITFDEERCNGCGLCVGACHECAIELVDGKARLIKDEYCDGLGNCLPECPTGAIRMIEREAAPFGAAAVNARLANQPNNRDHKPVIECAFSAPKIVEPCPIPAAAAPAPNGGRPSELRNWPVQIRLVNVQAPYLQGCRLLVAADCTAFASAAFHQKLLRGRVAVIGCPKLDDTSFYREKLAQIFTRNEIESVLIARMEVPCCSGLTATVRRALEASGKDIPVDEVIVGIDGQLIQ